MQSSESDDPLRPVSYIVLGLLATAGPQTSYELKQHAALSVGFFWPFPHSQLYAEPQRLVDGGLIEASVEDGGRRRRTYTITAAGRAALIAWLAQTPEPSQYRDPAMLRLFFAGAAPELVAPLAQQQVAQLSAELAFLEDPNLGGTEPHHVRVLNWGRATVRASLAFWQTLADETAETQ